MKYNFIASLVTNELISDMKKLGINPIYGSGNLPISIGFEKEPSQESHDFIYKNSEQILNITRETWDKTMVWDNVQIIMNGKPITGITQVTYTLHSEN